MKLATGKKIDPRKLDAKSLLEAARDERHAHEKEEPRRGLTSTTEERHEGGALARIDAPVMRHDLLARAARAAHRG